MTSLYQRTHTKSKQKQLLQLAQNEYDVFKENKPNLRQNARFWALQHALGRTPFDTVEHDRDVMSYELQHYLGQQATAFKEATSALESGLKESSLKQFEELFERDQIKALEFKSVLERNGASLSFNNLIRFDDDFQTIRGLVERLCDRAKRHADRYNELIDKNKYDKDDPERKPIPKPKSEADSDKAKAEALVAMMEKWVFGLTDFTRHKKMEDAPFLLRLQDESWWLRRINKKTRAQHLHLSRVLQKTGHGYGRNAYLPFTIEKRIHKQDELLKEWLEDTIINSGSTSLSLWDLNKNKTQQTLTEIRTRQLAVWNIATRERDHKHYLITITCPGRFHPTSTIEIGYGKKKRRRSIENPRFDKSLTVQDALEWKKLHWTKFRARLAKAKIDYTAFQALEGHSDGTPHWHVILTAHEDDEKRIKKLLEDEFLYELEDGKRLTKEELEKGAIEYRVNIKKMDGEMQALSYLTKTLRYLLKTQKSKDEHGNEIEKPSAEALYTRAISARAFSGSNGHAGMWRWLRSIRDPDVLNDELFEAWLHANGFDEESSKTVQRRKKGLLGLVDFNEENPNRFLKHNPTNSTHYERFLKSIAVEYKTAFIESDFYDIEFKTLADYADENGEITHESYLSFECDNANYFNQMQEYGDDWEKIGLIKSKKPKLNKYGEKLKAPKSGRFSQRLIRLIKDEDGNVIDYVAVDNHLKKNWERDESVYDQNRKQRIENKRLKEKEALTASQTQGLKANATAQANALGFSLEDLKKINNSKKRGGLHLTIVDQGHGYAAPIKASGEFTLAERDQFDAETWNCYVIEMQQQQNQHNNHPPPNF